MNVLRAQPIGLGLAALITAGYVSSMGIAAQQAPQKQEQQQQTAQQPILTPTFKTKVDLVSVTAVVRDGKGRVVRNLTREDFQVFEKGALRRIVDFKASDQGPISLAVLFDVSGSMRGSPNMEAGKRAVDHILSWVEPKADEFALFTFDKDLRQETPFTNDAATIHAALDKMTAMGLTSLYDAIADTAKKLEHRPSPRRAVVVITDGVDTASTLTPSQVSGLASAIDVPVYVIAVVSPLDHPGGDMAVPGSNTNTVSTSLGNLATWTGGEMMIVSAPADASLAARELITELRHQYLIAFESSKEAGWFALDVKTKRRDLTVRARSGYFANQRPYS